MGDPPSDTLWIGDLPENIDEDTIKTVFGAYGTVSRVKILAVNNGKGAAIVQFTTEEDASWIVENVNGNIAQGLPTPIVVKFAKNGGGTRGPGGVGVVQGRPPLPVISLGNTTVPKGSTPAQTAATIAAAAIAAAAAQGGGGGGGAGACAGGHEPQWVAPPQRGSHPYNGKGAGKGEERGSIGDLLNSLAQTGVFPYVEKSQVLQLYVSGLPTDTTDLDLYKLFCPFGCPMRPNGVKAMTKPDGSCTGVGFVDVTDSSAAYAAIEALHGTVLPDGSQLRVQPKRNQGRAA